MSQEVELILEKAEKMEKLVRSKEFKELFIDDFLTIGMQDISVEYFSAPPDRKAVLQDKLTAIGIVNNYINGIISTGQSAKSFAEEMYKFEQEM